MDASNFYLFVLPLGIFVFLLAILAFYYARGQEREQRRLVKLIKVYVKAMSKQKESYNKQLSKLQELLKTKYIDEVTFERMKQALENDFLQKREDAKMRLPSSKVKNSSPSDSGSRYAEAQT